MSGAPILTAISLAGKYAARVIEGSHLPGAKALAKEVDILTGTAPAALAASAEEDPYPTLAGIAVGASAMALGLYIAPEAFAVIAARAGFQGASAIAFQLGAQYSAEWGISKATEGGMRYVRDLFGSKEEFKQAVADANNSVKPVPTPTPTPTPDPTPTPITADVVHDPATLAFIRATYPGQSWVAEADQSADVQAQFNVPKGIRWEWAGPVRSDDQKVLDMFNAANTSDPNQTPGATTNWAVLENGPGAGLPSGVSLYISIFT